MVRLLKGGYRVRTTVRSLDRESDVRAMVTADGSDPGLPSPSRTRCRGKRVVLTSSSAAIGYGPPASGPCTEDTWTEPAGQTSYVKSKTLAERTAWDFMACEGALELAVINSTGISVRCSGPTIPAPSA